MIDAGKHALQPQIANHKISAVILPHTLHRPRLAPLTQFTRTLEHCPS